MSRYGPSEIAGQGRSDPISPTTTTSEWTMDSGVSRGMLRRTNSDSDPSFISNEVAVDRSGSMRKPRWFAQVKDWLASSEPSAQAMKAQKVAVYQKHGIDLKDPRAAAKLHLPMGQLPSNATTSTTGPRPEKALQKQREEERRKRDTYGGQSRGHQSVSSGFSSSTSVKDTNQVAPWQD